MSADPSPVPGHWANSCRQLLQPLWNNPFVGDIRHFGLLAGIELVVDKETRRAGAGTFVADVIGQVQEERRDHLQERRHGAGIQQRVDPVSAADRHGRRTGYLDCRPRSATAAGGDQRSVPATGSRRFVERIRMMN